MYVWGMNTQRKLLADIDAFCRRHQISDSEFGLLACNNVAFMHHLKRGRNIRLDTYERVTKFMTNYKPKAAKPRPRKAAANTVAA